MQNKDNNFGVKTKVGTDVRKTAVIEAFLPILQVVEEKSYAIIWIFQEGTCGAVRLTW